MPGLFKSTTKSLLWLLLLTTCFTAFPAMGEEEAATSSKQSNGKESVSENEASALSTKRQQPDPYRQRQQSIEQITQQITDKNQVVWLELGNTKVAALHLLATVRRPQGTVLLLHGNHAHLDQEGIIRTLRTQLPTFNWNTFSLSLPDFMDQPNLPERKAEEPPQKDADATTQEGTQSTDNNKDKEDKESDQNEPQSEDEDSQSPRPETDPDTVMPELGEPQEEEKPEEIIEPEFPKADTRMPKAILSERLQLALDYLARQPQTGKIIIVVEDIMASWICDLLATEMMAPEIKGLVLINAQLPEMLEAPPLSASITQLSIPVLDLISEASAELPANKNRYLKLRQSRKKNYEFNLIYSVDSQLGFEDRDLVLQKIRGWLRRRFEKVKVPGVTPL